MTTERTPPETAQRIKSLRDEAVRCLRRLRDTPETAHPQLYRQAADAMVKLRGLHTTGDGRPDWRGRTWGYRSLVNEIYGEAGLPPEPNHPVKAALRYHLGNALRESLTSEELIEAGLKPAPPRERAYERFMAQRNLSDFARSLIFHIEVKPNEPAPPKVVERAREVADALNRWIVRQEAMQAEGLSSK